MTGMIISCIIALVCTVGCERETETSASIVKPKNECVFRVYPGTAIPDARHTEAFYITGVVQKIADDKKEILLNPDPDAGGYVERFVISNDPKFLKDCRVGQTWAFKVVKSTRYFSKEYYELVCEILW